MGRLEFEEFELRIGRGHGESYPTWVVRSPAGEANGTFDLPFGPERLKDIKTLVELAMLRSRQRTRAALSSDLRELKTFGGDLFDALFEDAIGTTYDSSRKLALSQGMGLRLKLRIEPAELIDWPWEFLYDKAARRFIALSTRTPVVRYVELDAPLPPLKLTPPLYLLVVVANPSDYSPLNVEREKYRIRLALGELINTGQVRVEFLSDATVPALQNRLRDSPVHILHFIGHGGYVEEYDTGFLVFEDEHGEGTRVRGEQLRHLFGDVLSLRLVVLNACNGARGWDREHDPLKAYPGIAESLVHDGIAGVVANQFEVTDEAAIIFARELYSALADGYSIDAAVAEARKAIDLSLKNTVEWASPVLYSRAPDGLIFDTPGLALASSSSTEETPVPAFEAGTSEGAHGDQDGTLVSEQDNRPLGISSAGRLKIWLNLLAAAISSHLKLAATGFLGALLFVAVGFAAGRTVERSVVLEPSATAMVEPSAIPTATFSPTLEPARPVASFTPEPSPTVTPTRTPSPTSAPTLTPMWPALGLPAVIVEVDGFSSFYLRGGPGKPQCPILGGISAGTRVAAYGGWSLIGQENSPTGWGWVLIEPGDGEQMWVWGAAVRLIDPTAVLPETPGDEIPACASAPELPPEPTLTTRSQPAADNKPKDRDTDSSTRLTATPTPKPTEARVPTPTPSTIRGIPRPPTPTPGLTSASP